MSGKDKQQIPPPEKHDDVSLSENQHSCPESANPDQSTSATVSDKQISEEDGGFKTPTDQRIPAMTECPPPPQKPRPQPSRLKRKASPPGALQIEAEVESVFRQSPDDTQEHKIKKARITDDEDPA